MGCYGRVEEDLDEYEDDFIDRDDEIGSDEYEDENVEEEREDEPMSEEAVKLLKYRQKLKEQFRAKLRKENGASSSTSRDQIRRPPVNNFGSFFGPSKLVIADRVIQRSKALLETRHLAPKASTSQSLSDGKKVSMPSTSGPVNGVSRQPSAKQVKSKLQLMKDTRDYSFLYSDSADIPNMKSDPGPSRNSSLKPDTRPAQVPVKTNGSGGEVSNGFQHRKVSGTPHVSSARAAPPRKPIAGSRNSVVSSDSRRQLDLVKQPETAKHVGSSSGSRPMRPAMAKTGPQEKPLTATGQKAQSGSSVKRPPTVSLSNKGPPPAQKHSISNGQRPPLDKSRTLVGGNSMEHRRDVRETSGNKMLKKENTPASKIEMKPPRESSHRANLERDHAKNHGVKKEPISHSNGVRKEPMGHSNGVRKEPMGHSNGVRKEPVSHSNGVRKEPVSRSNGVSKEPMSRFNGVRKEPMSHSNGIRRESMNHSNGVRRESMSHSNGVRKEPIRKKRRAEDLEETKNVSSIIQQLFRYNPSRYNDDSDDENMEVGFDTILKEESRSARIARQEDEEELAKIMEEERQEKLRRKAKMRKLSQR